MRTFIIIPTYNEKNNIGKLIQEIFGLEIPELEILVVDDNSPDGTGDYVEELKRNDQRIHILHRFKKEGLGRAYIAGFKETLARGAEYIFEIDADFSHDPRLIPNFLKAIEDCDLVIGSKYVPQGKMEVDFFRNNLSYLGNLFAKFVLGTPFNDLTGGYRCYRRRALQSINFENVEASNYAFQMEMAYKVYKKGFRIKETPIVFTIREIGQSKFKFKMILEALLTVFKLRLGLIRD